LENDGLYDQVQHLKDDDGKTVSPIVFQAWVDKYGRSAMQKHLRVILAQKEHDSASFGRSEVAAFVDRLNHDYPDPDWYADLERQERLSLFEEVTPNQLSMDIYDDFFR
jgi:hypothetical protein